MADAHRKVSVHIVLTLTENEARLIHSAMQNDLSGCENLNNRLARENIFNELHHALGKDMPQVRSSEDVIADIA